MRYSVDMLSRVFRDLHPSGLRDGWRDQRRFQSGFVELSSFPKLGLGLIAFLFSCGALHRGSLFSGRFGFERLGILVEAFSIGVL